MKECAIWIDNALILLFANVKKANCKETRWLSFVLARILAVSMLLDELNIPSIFLT